MARILLWIIAPERVKSYQERGLTVIEQKKWAHVIKERGLRTERGL
jgi:hypothetical protein